ncbi:retrovirus-related Pol polyprotein from transposon TNT 1-94 [Trichonephila clavipes]|nr:retrovirus-related Pol polyprotein from transposon TNT 1-94 [Trichonephila clavipes]
MKVSTPIRTRSFEFRDLRLAATAMQIELVFKLGSYGKKRTSELSKIEAELILEANRLQLMKQDLEKAENAYLNSFTSKKSKTLPGATAAAHGDPNGKNDYQKRSGKQSPREFHSKRRGRKIKTSIGIVAYGPLCPMPTESQGGNKYFLSIIDDYSRKVTVFPIRNKSDVFHTFIRFQKRAERFLSRKVIAVRTDGGLEFCNKDMDNFLTELGIKHEVTNSYTPEMNGVAERFNLTALDGIKTLLKSSEVPHKFWGEALLCFTYAWNRICHKDKQNAFRKYSGRKPSVLHLKPFGCLAYAGVCQNKLEKIRYACENGNYDGIRTTKDNTESQGFSDLSEQQEALMVEVTIPNCYKQAIRSRDASKWRDAMDKEINVMMERKVWDLVDHPDNIKIFRKPLGLYH